MNHKSPQSLSIFQFANLVQNFDLLQSAPFSFRNSSRGFHLQLSAGHVCYLPGRVGGCFLYVGTSDVLRFVQRSEFESAEVTWLDQFGLLLELAWEMAALLLCFCSNMSSSSA